MLSLAQKGRGQKFLLQEAKKSPPASDIQFEAEVDWSHRAVETPNTPEQEILE